MSKSRPKQRSLSSLLALAINGSLIWILLLSESVYSFPENVRYGYVNCTSCHLSPNGGGVLTEYGRSLSREKLSTWGKEGEADFLYATLKTPKWLSLGGDFRVVQTHRDNPRLTEQRFIFMQADLEAAATIEKWQMVATLGRSPNRDPQSLTDALISRRHYVNFRPTDELSFRAGRFLQAFGINLPDHIVATRRGIGWDQGTETYNLEAAWLGENYDLFLTGNFGRPDASDLQREAGIAVRSSLNFNERHKLGLSYFYGGNDLASRHLFGPFAILGLMDHFFLLGEIDFQRNLPTTTGTSTQFGLVNYLRLNYELFQGFNAYVTQEYSKLNFESPATLIEAYGLGIQWFPRPHLEIQAIWQKRHEELRFPSFTDFAWLQFHFYL